MLTTLIFAVALIQNPTVRELKVGDVIHLAQAEPVRPSPQSPPVAAAPMPAPPIVSDDPYGFGPWLNGQRAARGLHALHHDPGLSNDGAVNSSRGFGHSHMGNARRQNAGMGHSSQVWPLWIQSPAHAAALFDRSIRHYGIANVNGTWTYNAR